MAASRKGTQDVDGPKKGTWSLNKSSGADPWYPECMPILSYIVEYYGILWDIIP